MLELRVPPPLQLFCFGLSMWALSVLFPDASFRLPGLPWVPLIFGAAGVAMGVLGFVEFRRAATTVDPLDPGKATSLVTSGIYRFSRNPMYAGLLAILIGWAVYLGSWVALLGLPLFVVYITRFQIQPEERAMAEKFGAAYERYRQSVRRWI